MLSFGSFTNYVTLGEGKGALGVIVCGRGVRLHLRMYTLGPRSSSHRSSGQNSEIFLPPRRRGLGYFDYLGSSTGFNPALSIAVRWFGKFRWGCGECDILMKQRFGWARRFVTEEGFKIQPEGVTWFVNGHFGTLGVKQLSFKIQKLINIHTTKAT